MDDKVTFPASSIRRLVRKIAGLLAECNYAQRRMTELATAPERYLLDPLAAPEDYADFLYRTSGLLMHEPAAAERARAGRGSA